MSLELTNMLKFIFRILIPAAPILKHIFTVAYFGGLSCFFLLHSDIHFPAAIFSEILEHAMHEGRKVTKEIDDAIVVAGEEADQVAEQQQEGSVDNAVG